jgi:hypothetical protein
MWRPWLAVILRKLCQLLYHTFITVMGNVNLGAAKSVFSRGGGRTATWKFHKRWKEIFAPLGSFYSFHKEIGAASNPFTESRSCCNFERIISFLSFNSFLCCVVPIRVHGREPYTGSICIGISITEYQRPGHFSASYRLQFAVYVGRII